MKGSEFLGQLAKQVALSPAGPWWFQGSREIKQDATPDGSENRSAIGGYIVKPSNITVRPA